VTRTNDSVEIYVINSGTAAGDSGMRVWCNARSRCEVFFSSRFSSHR